MIFSKNIRTNSLIVLVSLIIYSSSAFGKDIDTTIPQKIDYTQRVIYLHNLIHGRIRQSKLDSMAKIVHLMLDSIRYEITQQKYKDTISFLKTTLHNGLNDSLFIIQLNTILNSATGNKRDVITTYCIDRNTQNPIDSVKISLYSHDSLIAHSFSSHGGFCTIANLKPGRYTLLFSANNYTSFTDNNVMITAANISSLEIPLIKKPGLLTFPFSVYTWMILVAAIILLFVIIYAIIRRFVKLA